MKKLERRELKNLGINDLALRTYSNSDYDFYLADDGKIICKVRQELVAEFDTVYQVETFLISEGVNGKIIFDNGGGIIVQLPDYARFYGGYTGAVEQAAEDVIAYIKDGNTDGWEGNEEELAEEISIEDIKNGGYRVYELSELIQVARQGNIDSSWDNYNRFMAELAKGI
jgi:hypothetical protein